MLWRSKLDIISFLKLVAKFNLSDAEIEVLKHNVKSIGEQEYKLLEHHKINLLFFRHCKKINQVVELNKMKMFQYSNQLLVLQCLYKEYFEEIKKILCEFESQNISYAILKGFSFSQDLYFYDGVSYRSFTDIDLLVDIKECNRITNILTANFFIQGKYVNDALIPVERSEIIYWTLNSHQLPEFIKPSKYTRYSPRYRIEVDINTTIFEGGKEQSPISTKRILEHSENKKMFENFCYKALTPTYSLLQLCYHFYKDTIYKSKVENKCDYLLIKFCDIREFILFYKHQIDWDAFINITNSANIGNQIYYPLWLVANFYGDLNINNILDKLHITKTFEKKDLNWEGMLL